MMEIFNTNFSPDLILNLTLIFLILLGEIVCGNSIKVSKAENAFQYFLLFLLKSKKKKKATGRNFLFLTGREKNPFQLIKS
jgi:hypothetical protein